jgi:hypothetical protein
MARSLRAALTVGCLLVFTGCVDGREPTALAPGGPDYTIADAATGWNPAFYWLPPIVPPFAPSGVFDPSRAPVVRICAWSNGQCQAQIAEYTLTSGTGGETVTVDPAAEHYQVMWRTGSSPFQSLAVDGVYRITVSLDGHEIGFADAFIVARPRDRGGVDATQYVPVVRGSNFKIKFRIEVQTQLLDLHFDRKGDGPLGVGEVPTMYRLTVTNDPSGAMSAFYTDGVTAGTFVGERRFARLNPVVRMVYSDVDFYAVWAGRQNVDNSIEGGWFDAAGQTGDFRLVEQGQTVSRSADDGTRNIPSFYQAAGAAELNGGWILTFDRLYDGVYVPEPGGRNTLQFTANGGEGLAGVYTDGGSGTFEGSLHTARFTSIISLLFTNTDDYASFAGAMVDSDHIIGVYFDAEGYSGDFVLTRRYREEFSGDVIPGGWEATGGSWSVDAGVLTGSFTVFNVDPQLIRTNSAGMPMTIRARILNTPGAPEGSASIVFNQVDAAEYHAIELRTNAAQSAQIASYGPGGQLLASCPAGLTQTDTWYILELTDTPAGLQGRLLDGAGDPTSCTMDVPGAHVTNAVIGVLARSGGGLVRVDWIEVDTN